MRGLPRSALCTTHFADMDDLHPTDSTPQQPLAEALARLGEMLVASMPVDVLGLCLMDPDGDHLSCHALYEDGGEDASDEVPRVRGGVLGAVLRSGHSQVVEFVEGLDCTRGMGSIMLVALGCVGVVVVCARAEGVYDASTLAAADQIASALEVQVEKAMSAPS